MSVKSEANIFSQSIEVKSLLFLIEEEEEESLQLEKINCEFDLNGLWEEELAKHSGGRSSFVVCTRKQK